MGEAVITSSGAQFHPPLHGAHVTGRLVIQHHVPNSRNYGTNHHSAKVNTMLGKSVSLHQDGVVSAYLLYTPEVTEDLTLTVHWLRDGVSIELTPDEMEALAKRLTKGVKKMRKHRKKLYRQAPNVVADYVLRGRRK